MSTTGYRPSVNCKVDSHDVVRVGNRRESTAVHGLQLTLTLSLPSTGVGGSCAQRLRWVWLWFSPAGIPLNESNGRKAADPVFEKRR